MGRLHEGEARAIEVACREIVGAGTTTSSPRRWSSAAAAPPSIVASPCAVVLATMPPLLSTIANAGRHGVLIKSAVALEHLGQVDVVAFDKTGTLTEGTPGCPRSSRCPGSA